MFTVQAKSRFDLSLFGPVYIIQSLTFRVVSRTHITPLNHRHISGGSILTSVTLRVYTMFFFLLPGVGSLGVHFGKRSYSSSSSFLLLVARPGAPSSSTLPIQVADLPDAWRSGARLIALLRWLGLGGLPFCADVASERFFKEASPAAFRAAVGASLKKRELSCVHTSSI